MALSPSSRTKVFISYSHADKDWLERLKRHLKPLVREGRLDCWDDTHIRPGDDWKQEIRSALDTAQVAVLLISANPAYEPIEVAQDEVDIIGRVVWKSGRV